MGIGVVNAGTINTIVLFLGDYRMTILPPMPQEPDGDVFEKIEFWLGWLERPGRDGNTERISEYARERIQDLGKEFKSPGSIDGSGEIALRLRLGPGT